MFTYEEAVGRLICGDEDENRATVFLISPTKVVTARHAVDDYYLEHKEINLEFLNIQKESIKRKGYPIEKFESFKTPIAILELDNPVACNTYLKFCYDEIEKDNIYETFGYPVVKWEMGHRTKNKVLRLVTNDMSRPYDWDIDLNYDANIEDFSGLSGAPLFVKDKLVGVVLAESKANHKVISLGSVSVKRFSDALDKLEILIDESLPELSLNEIHQLDESMDFSESLFIMKLESAEIYDHEDCQQEFFNAEIAKSSVEGRGLSTEIKEFSMLKENIKSVWKTQHRSYKEENDGNDLLTKVYERVEDLNNTTLNSNLDIPLIIKKGILHQLSDECKVGWVKDYKLRLENFLTERTEIE
ncbi:trypsin-like serine protease [Paenibacillus sp. FSL K6-1122]|uniref:trypsin-like serine protease n=1 Tax=Paenibacillus sp. FSL K6-1122 TaxID=2954512 RepID=UPI0030ED023C